MPNLDFYDAHSYAPPVSYREEPLHLAEPFRTFVRETGKPEDFPGVYLGKVAKTEPFRIITEFEIDRGRRPEGDMAPCPMCGKHDHYLKGALVWFLRLKFVSPIGHECADKDLLRAERERHRRDRERSLEHDFLFTELQRLEDRLVWASKLLEVGREAQKVYRVFRGKGGPFQSALRKAIKGSAGALVIHSVQRLETSSIGPSAMKSSSGGVETTDIRFGHLRGTTALLSSYSPVREVEAALRLLRCDETGLPQEQLLDFVLGLDDQDRRERYIRFKKGIEALNNAGGRLADFLQFFAEDNISRVDQWASHPEAPMRFHAKIISSRVSGQLIGGTPLAFCDMEGEGHHCRVHLPPIVRAELPLLNLREV